MKRRLHMFTMVAISFGMAFAAQADPPELVSHQGLLMTASGTVVPDGGYDLRFRICTGPVGENCAWQQDMSVQVKNGVYSVLLSAAGLADQFQQSTVYLEVAITSAPPGAGIGTLPLVMTPRQQIASVPFALYAGQATTNATTDSPGVVRLATNAEAVDGTDATRALTPANLGQNYDDTARTGYFEIVGTGLLVQFVFAPSQGYGLVTLPTAFASSSYVVVGSIQGNRNNNMSVTPYSATQISVSTDNPRDMNFIAIGAKP